MTDNGVRVVGVEGLDALRRDLRALDAALPKELQKLNKRAAETVAEQARASYTRRYRQQSGTGAGSIRALATQTKAQVALGSARAPYMLGQEFGSTRYQQFPPYNSGQGEFFYPAVREASSDLPDTYADLLDKLVRENGWS